MNCTYDIKNFRVFDQKGASFELKPITILTGCNSSGKSSVVKSMMLLKDCIHRASKEYKEKGTFNPAECYLDFSAENLNLKSFDSTVNRNAEKKFITLSYTTKVVCMTYKVEMTFEAKENDFFNFGWMTCLNIYSEKGDTIMKASKHKDAFMVDYLCVDNCFFLDFEAIAGASTILYMKKRMEECCAYGDIQDEEEYEIWNQRQEAFISKIEQVLSRPIWIMAMNFIRNNGYDQRENSIFTADYEKPLERLNEDSIILYFPIMEKLRGLKKEEVIAVLENLEPNESYEYYETSFAQNNGLKDLAKRVAKAYEDSEFDSFFDFYRNLENIELKDVAKSQLNHQRLISTNFKENFFSGVEIVAKIQYTSQEPIHFLSEYESDVVNLNTVYKFLARWQFSEKIDSEEDFISKNGDSSKIMLDQRLYSAYSRFLPILLEKIICTDIFDRFRYIGNFQSEVKRLYTFDDYSNNLGNTIKTFLLYRSKLETLRKDKMKRESIDYQAGAFTNKWVKKLGIGKSINIIEDEDGLGAKVYLRKDKNRRGYPLADEGYGISQLVTFLLHIENEIIFDRLTTDSKVHYPLYVKKINRTIPSLSLEEPEVSLHPSMQSQLADIFYDAYKNYDIHFIVETHSEYLIRRTQALVAGYKSQEEFESKPFSVVYIGKGGQSYQLVYEESGRFSNSFGPGFFDEASRSSIMILKREKKMQNEKNV